MTSGSLFAGIGGFDLGFKLSGIECAWQVEIDPYCQKVLSRHWPDVEKFEDVKNVGKRNLAKVDVLCGGFPCQDLSVAGRRAGLAGERSGLWFEFARIISELEPRFVVIENVPGLLSSNGVKDMQVILDSLNESGYVADVDILDAQYFGVAQKRRRVFFICENLEIGLTKKSEFCARALCIAIIESSLNSLIGQGDPSKRWREGLISRVSQDGLLKRIKFFDHSRKQKLWAILPSVLADVILKSDHDCERSGCFLGLEQSGYTKKVDITKNCIKDIGWLDGQMQAEKDEAILSISKLWKKALVEPYENQNSYITSTEFQQTIELKICMSAKIVLLTLKHIVAWRIYCPFWWPVVSLALTALKEFTKYAGHASEELFIEPDIRREYWEYGIQAEKLLQSFGSLGNGSCSEILFEREGVSWDSPASRKAGQDIAFTLAASLRSGGNGRRGFNIDAEHGIVNVARSLNSHGVRLDGDTETFIAKTLTANYGKQIDSSDTNGGPPNLICSTFNGYTGGADDNDAQGNHLVAMPQTNSVRRLTPRECERLQGFPDDFTRWGADGEEISDSVRYRMLGNAVCVKNSEWIGNRLKKL